MKLLNRFKESTLRLAYLVIAMYCAVLSAFSFANVMFINRVTTDDCLWSYTDANNFKTERGFFLRDITPGGAADEAGLRNYDILIAINGKEFRDISEAQGILNGYDINDKVVYTVIREGQILNFDIKVYEFFNTHYLIFSLLGFGFLVIGLMVGYSRPKEFTSQLFFFMSACAILAFNSFGVVLPIDNLFAIINFYTGFFLFFPLFVHFFLTYPIRFESRYRKQIITLVYLPSAISAALTTYNIATGFSIYVFLSILLNAIIILYMMFGIIIFALSYKKLRNQNQKRSLKIIIYGFILGVIGFAYTIVVPLVLNTPTILIEPWVLIPSGLVLAIPISFGYSIFRYKILDTEFIVKRGLVFGFITAFVVGLYLLFVFVVDSMLSNYLGENRQIVTVILIIMITFTFDFVNKKVKEFVDIQFYRERYNYRQSLLLFSEELPYITNFNEILQKIGKAVNETMGIKTLNIWIKDLDFYKLIGKDRENLDVREKQETLDNAFTELFKISFEPKFLYGINLGDIKIKEEYKDIFRNSNIVLSVPITLKERLLGALNFGEKPSGKAYSEEDIDLLKTLASQSAIAFENARLQIEEISKQKIEEELQIAQKIQFGLLPQKDTTIPGLTISTAYQPAKLIGGDFFDLIRLDDKRLLIVVADVSGKGIPAALYMSKVQAMIQFAARVFSSPRDILKEVNKQIVNKIDKKTFITIIMALYDLEENKVKICRAGHNPLIYFNNGSINILENKGMGIGIGRDEMFETHLEETEMPIKKDDLFIFYSDGLTEAMNEKQELLGMEKVVEVVNENRYNAPPVINDRIVNIMNGFRNGAEPNDDVTVVIVKVD